MNEILPQLPVFEFQRVPWFENKRMVLPILCFALAVPIVTVVLWPVAAIIRKRYQRPLFTSSGNRALFLISRIVCLLELIFVIVLLFVTSRVSEDISLIGDGVNPWLRILHALAWAIAAGTILFIVSAVSFSTRHAGGLWLRAHTTLLALSGVAFVLIAWHWHLLDLSLKF